MDGRVFSHIQPMNSNGNAMASTSTHNLPDHISAPYTTSNGPQIHSISGPPHSQWPGLIPQNAHLSNQQPQLQSYSSWPPQCVSNGISSPHSLQHPAPVHQNQQNMSGFNNLGFFPAQILQDALRMSAPVGSVPDDDNILAQALHNSAKKGQTYKQAIEALHGTHNHAANLWKDYYLDHKPRIDQLVSILAGRPQKTAKKPTPPTYTAQSAPEPRPSQKRRVTSARNVVRRQHASGTRRSTINSLTTHTPVFDSHLPPPHADIIVPPPPSRSPTPPTEIVHGTNGNRYTAKDKKYFINFISWRLKCDPTLTKSELAEGLAEKAPHHSAMSWASHWHSQHDLADKILATAKGDMRDTDESQEDSTEEEPVPPRKIYKDDSSTSGSSSSASASSDDDSDADSLGKDERTSDDENNMGPARGPFTEADLRVTAKYIASRSDWLDLNNKDKWGVFSHKYPQRSDKSWGEYYRRNQRKIDRLVRKYETQKRPDASIQTQRGRPTWATRSPPKRKYSDDRDEESELDRFKRARGDSDDDADGEVDDDA